MHIDPALPTIVGAIIAISLMLSPAWIGLCKTLLGHPEGKPDHPRLR